jgi:hypothetical protein
MTVFDLQRQRRLAYAMRTNDVKDLSHD